MWWAVQYCADHPTDGEAIGLYLLGGAAVAGGLVYATLALAELRDREISKSAGRWVVAVGSAGVVTFLVGAVLFVANVHVDSETGTTPSTADFCDTHDCIPSFYEGSGSIVQCADGMWSHSGGVQGACSHHGGVGY